MKSSLYSLLGTFFASVATFMASALAQEVLYCVDTYATGFTSDNQGKVQRGQFILNRYTIKIVTKYVRTITKTTVRNISRQHECKPDPNFPEQVTCHDESGRCRNVAVFTETAMSEHT